jgi:hypothetical protein
VKGRKEGERGVLIGRVFMAITRGKITGALLRRRFRKQREKEGNCQRLGVTLTGGSHLSGKETKKEEEKEKEGVRGGKRASWAAARLVWAPGRPSWDDAVLFSFFCSKPFSISVSPFLLQILHNGTKQGQTNF